MVDISIVNGIINQLTGGAPSCRNGRWKWDQAVNVAKMMNCGFVGIVDVQNSTCGM